VKPKIIHITDYDLQRLQTLLGKMANVEGEEYLQKLQVELARAQVVQPKDIPPDVITMNRQVRLVDMDNGDEMIYTLVFPGDADVAQGRISILAPIGTAMIGYRVGDVFEWQIPDGVIRLKVKEILFQPEASGNYDL
jgi:regulator of nucleoside diphosphate kinase